jgi:hypothetical protein
VVALTLPSPFAIPHSRFNEFLFASIGDGGNGMPLSVVSALARLEIDPWQEAARLAALPKALAASALDGLIRRLPAGGWDPADTGKIAARLIKLLPGADEAARPGAARSSQGKRGGLPTFVLLLVLTLAAAALVGTLVSTEQRWAHQGASTAISNGVRSPAQP